MSPSRDAPAAKIAAVTPPIRLLAVDIDGTLLNPQLQISEADLAAMRRAHSEGVEVALVTGRRHAFAMPIALQLGFEVLLMSSNGAVTRSLAGETFHCDLMPLETCRRLCGAMREFRGNTVLTFDTEAKGAIVLEHLNELNDSIRKWLEKNSAFIEFVIPIENALTRDPVQTMFCGTIPRMRQAMEVLRASGIEQDTTVLRTEYPARDLLMIDVLNRECSKGHAVKRWADYRGIGPEQVMAIGDNYNDIEMLAFAGRPFIMGNAAEDMRREGWKITASNAENGVAAAIDEVLGAPSDR
jgi:Cof subfamily protein (haloacid dehalogenase superfamily)